MAIERVGGNDGKSNRRGRSICLYAIGKSVWDQTELFLLYNKFGKVYGDLLYADLIELNYVHVERDVSYRFLYTYFIA